MCNPFVDGLALCRDGSPAEVNLTVECLVCLYLVEDELELVMGGFFEREGMALGGVGGGGEWEWQFKLFSPFCTNP